MSKPKAAVFASGTGSNFQAMMEHSDLACDVVLLVSDQPEAKVIEKAENYRMPTVIFHAKDYYDKRSYEEMLAEKLEEAGVEWIFLAGYMRIVGETLLKKFDKRIVNIHPSLLPDFPGKDAIGQAYRAGVTKTGVTVHYIDKGIDTGPVIAQVEVPVLTNDTEETLKKRIQQAEHKLYPEVINQLLGEQKKSEG
ncbi:phosphoribosylglycinamide formyltransferase [Virgibacillus kimchii]